MNRLNDTFQSMLSFNFEPDRNSWWTWLLNETLASAGLCPRFAEVLRCWGAELSVDCPEPSHKHCQVFQRTTQQIATVNASVKGLHWHMPPYSHSTSFFICCFWKNGKLIRSKHILDRCKLLVISVDFRKKKAFYSYLLNSHIFLDTYHMQSSLLMGCKGA